VRIDLIYATASQRYRAFVNVVGCLLLGLPLVYVLGTKAWPLVLRSLDTLEKSAEAGGMPAVYIFKSLILVFCFCLGIQLLALLIRSAVTLFTGRSLDDASREGEAS
jgi:TRAP-type mannitol/chloroaromatic compound transport system permease small subunit